MIGKLKGTIDELHSDHLIVDVGGVGYLVYVSPRTLSACEPGTAKALIIETHVREDHIHLYGFLSQAERDAFRLLTTVQGVGVRMALAILGQFDTDQLQTIIAAQDKKRLTSVSGVGPKLAERIITELKSKAGSLGGAAAAMLTGHPAKTGKAVGAEKDSAAEDAVSALANLGYGRADAYEAVARARAQGEHTLDALIKAGLKELSG